MTQRLVSRIEHSLRIVTDYELACFCRALGVTEREMLSDFYEQQNGQPMSDEQRAYIKALMERVREEL